MIYDGGRLLDDEWFYTDMVYFVGDLTWEEVREATRALMPDAVEYDTENRLGAIAERYKGKKVVYVWWD